VAQPRDCDRVESPSRFGFLTELDVPAQTLLLLSAKGKLLRTLRLNAALRVRIMR
jgi:hypothetical protein